MNLLIDDRRTFPVCPVARTYEAGIRILKEHKIYTLWLDYDLGEEKTGHDIIKWLENHEQHWPEEIVCISANKEGIGLIEAAVKEMGILGSGYYLHPQAVVDDLVGQSGGEIGRGTMIWAFACVAEGAKIGKHCQIGQGASIGRNVVIGDYTKIQNNVSIYERMIIGEDVWIGPNTIIRSNCGCDCNTFSTQSAIGKESIIGANSVLCAVCTAPGLFVPPGTVRCPYADEKMAEEFLGGLARNE